MDHDKSALQHSTNVVREQVDWSIGAILIRSNRLTPTDNARILRFQQEHGLRFGDAALKLGLLTKNDIEFALSLQFDDPYLIGDSSKLSDDLFAAYARESRQFEELRALRNQLTQRWFGTSPDRKALTIISGQRHEGRSFIIANLAIAFCLLGKRTLLIDTDLRHPSQHSLFGLDNRSGLSAVLSSRGGVDLIQPVRGLVSLAVLPAGVVPPNPSELLARPHLQHFLNQVRDSFDVIFLDSPATEECADAQTLVELSGGALIVARKNTSRIWRARGVSNTVTEANATVVGAVLNEF